MDLRSSLTASVRATLRRADLDLVRHLGDGHLLKQVARVLADRQIDVVFDVGANIGQWARTVRALGYEGTIVSFEPLSGAYSILEAATQRDRKWQALNLALGEGWREATIHVAGNSQSSSMLEMTPSHEEAAPGSIYTGDETVKMGTLAWAIHEHAPRGDAVFVKIDAQGYEERVLKGAGEALDQVAAMQIELSLVPLYRDEPLIEEIVGILRSSGFVPTSFEPNFWSKTTGHVLQVDALFVRA